MPFKSVKQERYFNANRGKLESQGVNVDEWDKSSKGLKLPESVPIPGQKPQMASGLINFLKKRNPK